MRKNIILLLSGLLFMMTNCKTRFNESENKLNEFIKKFENWYIPLNNEANKAWYEAAVSGNKKDYDKSADLNVKLNKMLTNREEFAYLKSVKESGNIHDPILARQLEMTYLHYLGNQSDTIKLEEAIRMQTQIEKNFTAYRSRVDTKQFSDNQVDSVLRNSKNSNELEKIWKASKQIGVSVAPDLVNLIKKRNEIAKELGYANYHDMQLKLGEQDPKEVEALFDELDTLTKNAYIKLKGDIDAYLSKRYGIPAEKLMPWHYQNRFFQEAPAIYSVNLDHYYEKANILKLAENYYKSIGLPVDDIIARSDLYEKPGKNQHAFCSDIDHSGDIRILVNVRNDAYWMNTLLHELGHGVYSKYNDNSLPYLLRDAAHALTTEGIALFFGKLYAYPTWIRDNLNISDQEVNLIATDCKNTIRLDQLVFSRWSQVMFRFEKALYENPDQDLNKLWWDLVEKYQLLKRPKDSNGADWASKIHIVTSPCYYHNYLMGELFASQLYSYICINVLKSGNTEQSFTGKTEAGKYLLDNVFKPGARYKWTEMIERATGEKLTAKYYAKQFVN
jgi:peptidyl-dipeptidase A